MRTINVSPIDYETAFKVAPIGSHVRVSAFVRKDGDIVLNRYRDGLEREKIDCVVIA